VRSRRWKRATFSELLLALAAANCVIVFTLLVVYGRGVGLGQGFFPAVVLAALVGGPVWGVLAGFAAVVLDVTALFAHGGEETWSRVFSTADIVRLTSYVLTGFAVGYASQRGRRLLQDSLDVLEGLLTFAGRDLTTAALASQGLELEIVQRLSEREPFSLLVLDLLPAETDGADEDWEREVAAFLSSRIGPGDELARIGPGRFAVVGSAASTEAARHSLEAYDEKLGPGAAVAVGAAAYPADGMDTLSLFSAALDRLHAAAVAAR